MSFSLKNALQLLRTAGRCRRIVLQFLESAALFPETVPHYLETMALFLGRVLLFVGPFLVALFLENV